MRRPLRYLAPPVQLFGDNCQSLTDLFFCRPEPVFRGIGLQVRQNVEDPIMYHALFHPDWLTKA